MWGCATLHSWRLYFALVFTVYTFPQTRFMVREIQYTPTHIDYCDIAVSFSVHLQNYVLSTRCVNEVKRKRGFSKQTWKERVCVFVCAECFHWGFFNQGVTLSVPIRYSRQGSPAGCFWTTPSKKQIMLPHSDSKKINSSPSPSLFLLHIMRPDSDRCRKKRNATITGRRAQPSGGRKCLVTWRKKKKGNKRM